jgi:putative effector of murein hydrolase
LEFAWRDAGALARGNAGRLRTRQYAAASLWWFDLRKPGAHGHHSRGFRRRYDRDRLQVYFAATQLINFLLGPATVALAVPLARSARLVRENLLGVGLALLAGSVTSILSGIGLVWLFGGSRTVALSMAPKAATTPIAVAVSGQIGGIPALTAALAILGGIVAAVVGRKMLTKLNINDWQAHGLAAGIAGSGIAAAQVAACNVLGAAFAAVGIGLNGVLIGLVVPVVMQLWK